MLLIFILMFMKKSLLVLCSFLACLSVCSCKSVGVKLVGKSTILRNDTICTTYEYDKPVSKKINIDY